MQYDEIKNLMESWPCGYNAIWEQARDKYIQSGKTEESAGFQAFDDMTDQLLVFLNDWLKEIQFDWKGDVRESWEERKELHKGKGLSEKDAKRQAVCDVFNRVVWLKEQSKAYVTDANGNLVEIKMPRQTRNKKIGRNQPCPCGSGRKYKKCCAN